VTSEPRFAHASEAELARILDYYGVAWQYEPRTFPILWNPDGKVVESFSPDFYLPELELYVELTTLKQSLVRRKNRKLRRLRELYPDVRVKLFYGKDFRALMLKYGQIDLAASLSGLEGQIMPGTAADEPESEEADAAQVAAVISDPVATDATEPLAIARRSRARVSRGARRRRGRRAYLAARSAA
jgi:hypoxanthine phosphoribosyltransferase